MGEADRRAGASKRAGLALWGVVTGVVTAVAWQRGWLHAPPQSDDPVGGAARLLEIGPVLHRILIIGALAFVGVGTGRILEDRGWRHASWTIPLILWAHPRTLMAAGTDAALDPALAGAAMTLLAAVAAKDRWGASLGACSVALGLTALSPTLFLPWLPLCVLGPVLRRADVVRSALRSLVPVALACGVALLWKRPLPADLAAALSGLLAPLPGGLDVASWQQRAAFPASVVLLLLFGWHRVGPRDGGPLLLGAGLLFVGVVVAVPQLPDPDIQTPSEGLAAVAGFALILGICAASAFRIPGDRIVVLAASAVLVVAGYNRAVTAAAVRESVRGRAVEILRAVEALPRSADIDIVDLVFSNPPLVPDLFARSTDVRLAPGPFLIDPGAGAQLRVSRWVPGSGSEGGTAGHLDVAWRAHRPEDDLLALVAPEDGASLAARVPSDEPTFSWSVPIDADPGPDAFLFAWVGQPLSAKAPLPTTVDLDQTMLARTVTQGRAIYSFRPSVRSQRGGHRELAWEQEDLARRGTTLSWTILWRRPPRGLRMAAPRLLHVAP